MRGSKAILTKLARVLGEVQRVPKNGRNAFHKYDYTTESDLVDFIRPLLAAEKLFIVPSIEELIRENGKTIIRMSFTLADGDSGETLGPQSWYGEADDKGDKGLYKAITGGVKYFLFKTFLVSTGDDPENDHGHKPQKPRSTAPQASAAAPAAAPKVTIKQRADEQPADVAELVKELYKQYKAIYADDAIDRMKHVTGKKTSSQFTAEDCAKLADDLRGAE